MEQHVQDDRDPGIRKEKKKKKQSLKDETNKIYFIGPWKQHTSFF